MNRCTKCDTKSRIVNETITQNMANLSVNNERDKPIQRDTIMMNNIRNKSRRLSIGQPRIMIINEWCIDARTKLGTRQARGYTPLSLRVFQRPFLLVISDSRFGHSNENLDRYFEIKFKKKSLEISGTSYVYGLDHWFKKHTYTNIKCVKNTNYYTYT